MGFLFFFLFQNKKTIIFKAEKRVQNTIPIIVHFSKKSKKKVKKPMKLTKKGYFYPKGGHFSILDMGFHRARKACRVSPIRFFAKSRATLCTRVFSGKYPLFDTFHQIPLETLQISIACSKTRNLQQIPGYFLRFCKRGFNQGHFLVRRSCRFPQKGSKKCKKRSFS